MVISRANIKNQVTKGSATKKRKKKLKKKKVK